MVLDFPICPALGNGGAQNVDFGSANRRKLMFFAPHFRGGGHMNTHVGDKIFQETPRRVATFRENLPRDVEKSVV